MGYILYGKHSVGRTGRSAPRFYAMNGKALRQLFAGLAFLAALTSPALRAEAQPAPRASVKVDDKAFNDFYAAQSQKLYGHLMKAAEYCNTLSPNDEKQRPQDALAIRASLSACWELFLNAGDMVYIYDRLDPGCPKSLETVRELIRTGLTVVAGKMEKELLWLEMAAGRAKDVPIAVQAKMAEKDIKETIAAFREYSALFNPSAAPKGRQAPPTGPAAPAAKGQDETAPAQSAPETPVGGPVPSAQGTTP